MTDVIRVIEGPSVVTVSIPAMGAQGPKGPTGDVTPELSQARDDAVAAASASAASATASATQAGNAAGSATSAQGALESTVVAREAAQGAQTAAESARDAAQASSWIVAAPSWTTLSALSGTFSGQRAQVYGDAGTHTDPVVGGTVANAGVYAWSTAPAGWQWVADIVDFVPATAEETAEGVVANRGVTPASLTGIIGPGMSDAPGVPGALLILVDGAGKIFGHVDGAGVLHMASIDVSDDVRVSGQSIVVTMASPAEVLAGLVEDKATTPKGVRDAIDALRGIPPVAEDIIDTALLVIADAEDRQLAYFDAAGAFILPEVKADGVLIGGSPAIPESGLVDAVVNVGGSLPAAEDVVYPALWVLATSTGQLVGYVDAEGVWRLPDLDVTGDVKVGGASIAGSAVEVVAARGSRNTLSDRLGAHLAPYGVPKHRFGTHRLRETHQRLMCRRLGEARQLSIATIGDSYTHNASRWTGPAATYLTGQFGDAGGGWVGFGDLSANLGTYNNGNVRPSSYGYSRTGTWTTDSLYYTGGGLDLGAIQSASAGARVTLTVPASPALSEARLFWEDTADGVVRYSWDGGSTWTSVNTQGTLGNFGSAALSVGMPVGVGALWVEVVSGTVKLYGVLLKSSADGVVVHKLGATGSRAQQWATMAASAQWRAQLAALAPNLIEVMHGTNDQGASRTPDQFAADIATILDQCRVACPTADLLVMMPPENQRTTNTYPMAHYTAAALEVVAARDAAFLDTQLYFGAASADYAYGSPRPWYAADLIHPDPTTGGRALVASFLDALLYP